MKPQCPTKILLGLSFAGYLVLQTLCAPVLADPNYVTLKAGNLHLKVSSSPTAQLFHIVDQISNWSSYCHPNYQTWAKVLDATDRRLLKKHAAMRAKRGWGNGFEQAFYSDGTIDETACHAIRNHFLSAEEAQTESEILKHSNLGFNH